MTATLLPRVVPSRVVLPALVLALTVPGAPARAAERSLVEPAGDIPVLLGEGWLSTAANDFNLSTDAGERLLVFGRSSTGDFSDAQVWIARRDGGEAGKGWTQPESAGFSDPRWRHSDPWLTPDGRWLYFVSNRPAPGREGSREDLDLWRAPVDDGRVGTLEHLAGASSPGEELGPEVHDGWLVFNSTRAGGPAPLSLYRAELGRDLAAPAAAEPMPAPFNDGRVQGDLTFSADGGLALFWSVRGDSQEPDLFAVRRDGAGWSAAVRLPAPFNAPGMDFTPSFSPDGRTLRWASQRGADPAAGADARADLYAAPVAGLEGL